MDNIYINLNGVSTHLITYGKPFDGKSLDVVLCVTGNPGIPDFYIEFGSEIYNITGLPVCIVGHAGHEEVADEQSNVFKGQEHLFDLKGQLMHKLDLIRNHFDNKCKLHLIGHSIGAWMIVELLQNNDDVLQKVTSVNLLFPTLQRMAVTRNGVFLNCTWRKFHLLVMNFVKLFCLLPNCVFNLLIKIYLIIKSLPPHYIDRISKYINPKVIEKVLFLAYNKMDTVLDLNTDGLDKIKHMTNVIYSDRDDWAPLSYMEDLKVFKPNLQMTEVKFSHAFVLKTRLSEQVASMVSDFIIKHSVAST